VAEHLSESFPSFVAFSPYIAIFLLLTAGIWLIPFAEEIALTTAGYLYYAGEVRLITVLSVASAGVFLGDFLAYRLGRRWSSARLQRPLTFLGSRQWLGTVKAFLDRYGTHALFWARFLPGVRLPAHVLVGLHGMPVATYTRVSLLSVAAYVPVIFALAYSFGDEIEAALGSLKSLQETAWGLFFLAVSLWFMIRFWTSRLSLASRRRPVS